MKQKLSQQEILAEAQRRGLINNAQAQVAFPQEQIRAEAQRRGLVPTTQDEGGTVEDFTTGVTTGFLGLPTAAFQGALEAASAVTDPTEQGVVMRGIGSILSQAPGLSPEAQDRLRGLTLADARQAFQQRAQALEAEQQAARETSPVAATVGEIAGQIAPLLPLGAFTGGAAAGALQPETRDVTPEEALQERALGAAIGGTVGKVGEKVIQAVPGLTRGASQALRSGATKLAGINKSAAKDFADTGVQTSLAAVSDRPSIKLFDRTISRFPGSAGVIGRNTEKTIDDIQSVLNKAGADKGVTAQEAGAVIREGGEKFVGRFQDTSRKLFNRLDKFIPQEEVVTAPNTSSILTEEVGKARSPALQQRLEGTEAFKLLRDISEDSATGQMPYSSLKRWRTLVGEKLSKPSLLPGEDEALLRRLYGSLSEDMRAVASGKGDQALKAFNRANDFYREGATKIEKSLNRIISKGTDEEIFNAALQGTKAGGSKINRVMKSLAPEEKEIVRGSVLGKMGKRNPDGEFSTRTYLTEWQKLSPEAKDALFGRRTTMRNSLDRLANVTARINDLDRFANPSGTSQAIGTGLLALGSFVSVPLAVKALLGANASSRLMTNQGFVKWLANASEKKATPEMINKQISGLKRVASQNPDIADDIAKYVGILGAVASQTGNEN